MCVALSSILASGAGCDLESEGSANDDFGQESRLLSIASPWQSFSQSVRQAEQTVLEHEDLGSSLADLGCLLQSDDPIDSCLEVLSMPVDEASPCQDVPHAGFDDLAPQRSVDLWLSETHVSSRLWFDSDSQPGLMCQEIYIEQNDQGTCVYKNCLVNGTSVWTDAVFGAYAPELESAIGEALRAANAPWFMRQRLAASLVDVLRGAVGVEIDTV